MDDPTLRDRIMARVEITETCWLWRGGRNTGYGCIAYQGSSKPVHRLLYQLLVADVPKELHMDHLCRVRHCVNPAHLEPVTPRENTMRGISCAAVNAKKTHCPQGHPYDQANTMVVHRSNGEGGAAMPHLSPRAQPGGDA